MSSVWSCCWLLLISEFGSCRWHEGPPGAPSLSRTARGRRGPRCPVVSSSRSRCASPDFRCRRWHTCLRYQKSHVLLTGDWPWSRRRSQCPCYCCARGWAGAREQMLCSWTVSDPSGTSDYDKLYLFHFFNLQWNANGKYRSNNLNWKNYVLYRDLCLLCSN